MRHCDGCTLCCSLLPIKEIGKPAGVDCKHQCAGGCGVYRRADLMPRSCRLWNCRWLVDDDTADQLRPDVSHLVIDMMPDFVALIDDKTGKQSPVEVVQVWCDPAHRDAHRDPAFRAYVERRARENKATIVRFSSSDAVTLFAPALSGDGQWHEVGGKIETEAEHRRRGKELGL
jgi:hypothetical protein